MSTGSGRTPIKLLKNESGSIMLEFVFVISLLMVVFMAMVTFSFHFADCYGIQKVAREGAREASITGDTDWAGVRARQAAWLWGLDPDKMSVDFTQNGTTVTCSVAYKSSPFHKTFLKMIGGGTLKDIDLNARTTFVWSESN
ncbi:MAG: pilus assembly protein [Peptococcaceae bacterium]|nr:pilus assembly protein [Peptococcaceae bacterium]